MKAAETLNMVEYPFLNRCFIIVVILINDDSTMRAVLKHSSIGARGQDLNLSKVKIDE